MENKYHLETYKVVAEIALAIKQGCLKIYLSTNIQKY